MVPKSSVDDCIWWLMLIISWSSSRWNPEVKDPLNTRIQPQTNENKMNTIILSARLSLVRVSYNLFNVATHDLKFEVNGPGSFVKSGMWSFMNFGETTRRMKRLGINTDQKHAKHL
jgi:hypothetical protein